MHRQVSGKDFIKRLLNSFIFFCLLSPSMLYAVGKKNKIAFVGASMTAGAGKGISFHKPASHYFKHLRYNNSFSVINHSPVADLVELYKTKQNPVEKLTGQIRAASKEDPKMIIAIDALFWVVYNARSNDVLESLEKALAVMTKAKQNFVISLLPDLPVNTHMWIYRLPTDIIVNVNKRLKQWSQEQNDKSPEQGKVLLLDLNSYFDKDSYFNCGKQLGMQPKTEIMAKGEIHPTEFGHLCLAGRLLDELCKSDLPQFNFIASHFNIAELVLPNLSKKPSHRHDEH